MDLKSKDHLFHQKQRIEVLSLLETQELSFSYKEHIEFGDNILVSGPMGAGKSFFIRGFLSQYIDDLITSPTYTIIQSYEISYKERNIMVHHMDLYRLTSEEELYQLPIFEYLLDKENLVFIEWGERFQSIINLATKKITIEIGKQEFQRIFTF